MSNTITEKETVSDTLTGEVCTLILHNDDVHTFDDVIKALVKICGHSREQAEQCTLLVHYKGKCDVKRGSRKALTPMRGKLSERGLTVSISN
ncbi:MAG: ATP-dependent Clp protease adaptor ClpS [Bacteroidia bacterium]|nr:ATP-dependent Clp protease adaptor ClpS [Bacteroidia bacterium]